jgi:hypothetical protein
MFLVLPSMFFIRVSLRFPGFPFLPFILLLFHIHPLYLLLISPSATIIVWARAIVLPQRLAQRSPEGSVLQCRSEEDMNSNMVEMGGEHLDDENTLQHQSPTPPNMKSSQKPNSQPPTGPWQHRTPGQRQQLPAPDQTDQRRMGHGRLGEVNRTVGTRYSLLIDLFMML